MLTVITPATASRLASPDLVAAELGLTDSTELLPLIDQASDAVRAWCGRTFAIETVRETFDRVGLCASLTLSRWPIVAIEAVTIGDETVDMEDIESDLTAGLLRIGRRSAARVAITYSAGYVLPGVEGRTLPHDIERAVVLMVKAMWFARGRDPMLRSEDVDGVSSIAYQVSPLSAGTLTPEVEGLLSRHRQAVAI